MNPALLGSAAALAWGAHDFLARFPSRRIGPLDTVFAVTAAGFLALSAYVVMSGAEIRIVWSALWLTAVTGIFFALATLSLFAALAIAPISFVCPIAGAYPALAMLYAVATGSWPSLLAWAAVGAVMAGVVLVSQSGGGHEASGEIAEGRLPRVLALAGFAAVGFAISLTAGQVATPVFGHAPMAWLARIFGLATIGVIFFVRRRRPTMPKEWLPLLGLMGGLDATALTLIAAAGAFPDPALATVASSAFGAVSVLLARVFLKERIGGLQLAGILLVFVGVGALARA